MNNTSTVTLHQPQLLYASSITTLGSGTNIGNGTSIGSGTTNDEDGLQSTGTMAGTFIITREYRNHTKHASNPGTTCKLA